MDHQPLPCRNRAGVVVLRMVALALLVAGWLGNGATEDLQTLRALSFDELMEVTVITATKSSERLADAPASVTVISAAEIERFGWRDLAEVLASQVGFTVFSDRIYDFVVPRGFYLSNDPNSRILLLVNGHSVVEMFGYYNGHLPSIDLNHVLRIEIVRGPGSATYGTNAMFAVVNVITKRGQDLDGLDLVAEIGSFGHRRLSAAYGDMLTDSLEVMVQGTFLRTGDQVLYFDEYDNPAYDSGGYCRGSANIERQDNFSFFLSYRDFSLHGLHNDRKKRVPTGLYGGRFDDDQTFFQDINDFIEVRYGSALSSRSRLDARVFADWYRFKGRFVYYPDPTWTLGPPYESEYNEIENNGYGTELLLSTTWNKVHRSLFGAEYRYYQRVRFSYRSENDRDRTLDEFYDIDPRESIWALYAMHRMQPSTRILAEVGIHYDHYRSVGGHLSLRGSLAYRLSSRSWLKLLYGEAFRAPNLWEQQGGFYVAGNPTLDPEVVRTGEIILDARLGSRLNLRTSVYHYTLDHNIQAAAGIRFENVGGVSGSGIEGELRYLAEATEAFASLSYSAVEHDDLGLRIEFSPRLLGKLGLVKQLLDGRLTAAVESQIVGPRLKGLRSEPELGSYTVTNVTLSGIRLSRWLEGSFSVYNLFDEQYQHPSFIGDLATWSMNSLYPVYDIPADGRAFAVRLRATFRGTGERSPPR